MKNSIIIISFLLCAFQSKAQLQIKSMQCEGAVPHELKKSLSAFVDSAAKSDFESQSLLGVFQMLNSGNIVYGNASHNWLAKVGAHIQKTNNIVSDFHFEVLRSGMFNAFATDDGFVFATTALLAQVESEDELAFVLCHEISHVLLHHNLQTNQQREKTISDAIQQIKKARKNKKEVSQKDLENSLDNLLRDYFAYSRKQELQADSLGLELYLKTGYSLKAVKSLLTKLESAFPIFNQFNFKSSLLFPTHQELAEFLKSTEVFKINTLAVSDEKSEEDEEIDIKNYDSLYQTHPDAMVRVEKLEKNFRGSKMDIEPTALPPNLNFELLSEQFIHHMQFANFEIAAVYLNIIEQLYPAANDISAWKSIVLASLLLNADNKADFIPVDSSSNALVEFNCIYHVVNPVVLAHSALELSVGDSYSTEISRLVKHYQGVLLNYIKNNPTDSVFVVKDAQKQAVNFTCNSFNKSVKPAYWTRTNPTMVYNSEKRNGIENPNVNREGNEFLLLHANTRYNSYRNQSGLEVAHKTESGSDYMVKEIVKYGKRSNNHFTTINTIDREAISTEDYNAYHNVLNLVQESFYQNDTNLRPIGTVNFGTAIANSSKVNVIFENCYDGKRNGFGIFLVETYINHFSFMVFSDLGGMLDNINSKYICANIVLNLKSGQIDYVGIYNYNKRYRYETISAIAQKMNMDLRRYYK